MSLFNSVHHTLRDAATEGHNPPTTCPTPPVTNFAAFAPLGTISILPRELRDHIFNHVCNQGPYHFVNDFVEHPHYGLRRIRQKWLECDYPMLRVSKAVREEFLDFLCSKRFFEISHLQFSLETRRSDIPFLNDISKIIISVDLEYMSDGFKSWLQQHPSWSAEQKLLSAIKAEPLSFFTGTSVMRKVCILDLFDCWPTSLLTLLSSPLMHAMCQLTGFATVRLEISTNSDHWLKRETPRHIRQTFYSLGTCPGFDTTVLRIISALEPSLGPSTGSRFNKTRPWTQRVTFHPQDRRTHKVVELGANSSTEREEEIMGYFTHNWTKDYHQ